MALAINTNIASLQAQNAISNNSVQLQNSMQMLSTGMRINSAKDDAAGLAIADNMTQQINGLIRRIKQRAISSGRRHGCR